ncbi:AbrB/MazE/SpoVT family DNA-binding domain-containing protein [Endozoicomonas sp. Mp262]|uniref:AbrB/MazE/SpoVT family DNA-binding domain-containing protein n=1 Tax=Endozoicomonas sp. Mp262 TaxID=2919499 RepID=UPI0021DAC187
MESEIKRWGNSAAVRIPSKVLARAGLEVDSPIEIKAKMGEIILKAASPEKGYSLEELLKASPKESFDLSPEDQEWLNDNAKGWEVF